MEEMQGLFGQRLNERPASPDQQGVPTPTPGQTSPQTPDRPSPTALPPLTTAETQAMQQPAFPGRSGLQGYQTPPPPPSFPATSGLQGYPQGRQQPAPGPTPTTAGGAGQPTPSGGGAARPAPPPVTAGPAGPAGPPGGGAALNAPAPATGPPTQLVPQPGAPPPAAPPPPGQPSPQPTPPQPPAGPPPQGSLWDPRRQAAFDPTADLRDPGNVGVTRPGGAVDPQQQQVVEQAKAQFNQAVMGGVHFAQWLTRQGENHPHAERDQHALHAGVGMINAQTAQNIYEAWSDQHRADPAMALTRYMVYRYNALSATGHMGEANQMAFEILQRLNYEASRLGGIALDFMENGEYPAAVKALQQAHAFTPDGLKLATANNGTGVMLDEFTGLPTSAPFRITPQFILGSAMHLASGRGMWNALAIRAHQAAGAGRKPAVDKDAEGRALRNAVTRERLRILQQGGGRGRGRGRGGTTMTEEMAEDARRVNALSGAKITAPGETTRQESRADTEDPQYMAALMADEPEERGTSETEET